MGDSLVGMLSNIGNPILLNNAAETGSTIGGSIALTASGITSWPDLASA